MVGEHVLVQTHRYRDAAQPTALVSRDVKDFVRVGGSIRLRVEWLFHVQLRCH